MNKLFALAVALPVMAVAGCRSVPIVPDLAADQLLVNQAPFESAVQQRIVESCVKEKEGPVTYSGPLNRFLLCETGTRR